MVATPTQSRILKFALFEVDLEAGELRKSGMRQKLAGQPFEVLKLLLERPQEIVTREELQQRIWPKDTFVDYDLALRKAITRLREALGDSAESPRFIETIPRRGYRFIAAVNGNGSAALSATEPPSKVETETEPRASRRIMRIGIVLGFGAAVLLGAVLALTPAKFRQRFSDKSTVPPIRSIAVLPLQNLSADPAQEYFSDGMTDALITDLAQISSLKVISRTSSMQYKQTKKSLPEIAHELNVDGIVEGTVQRSGDRVRITAQLIYGPSDKHVWAHSYEKDLRDVFALERDVTEEISRQVQSRLTTPEHGPRAQPRPVAPKVLEAYLQGNYHLSRYGERDQERKKAAEYFQQAIDADPNFAPAYNGLAWAHQDLPQGSSEDVAIARRAAERAIELDPNYSDARATLGFIKWQPDLDWRGAEEELNRAIALNPNNADAHSSFGLLLIAMGRVDEGLQECGIAEQLDPVSDNSSICLYLTRDYDGSIERVRMILQRDPDNGFFHFFLFQNYSKKGMYKEAIQELEKAAGLYGFPETAARIQRAFAVSGYQGAIRQWVKEMEHLQATNQAFVPGNLAAAYTILGDKDRAFYWLEQAYEHREMVGADGGVFFLKSDPMLDPLRSDPRFKDLLRRVGLPP